MRQHEQDDHEQDSKAGRRGANQPTWRFGRILRALERCNRHGTEIHMLMSGSRRDRRDMTGVPGSVVTGRHDEVVHAHQGERKDRHHEEARRECAGRSHPPIVTRARSQRAPRPFSLLDKPRYSA